MTIKNRTRPFTIIDEGIHFGFLKNVPVELKERVQCRKFMAYVDDFAVRAKSKIDCVELLNILQQLCEKLGLAFNADKNQSPTQK